MYGKVISSKGEITLQYNQTHEINFGKLVQYFYLYASSYLRMYFNDDDINYIDLNPMEFPFILNDVPIYKIKFENVNNFNLNEDIKINYHGLYQ